MRSKIYLISGLGADERVFTRLNLGNYEPQFIQWVAPLKDETLPDYAARLSTQITCERPTILGVSFGGMLAVEMAKQMDCARVIVVSSAKTMHEIPFLYRFLGRLKIHKIIPTIILKQANFLTFWLFGMKTKEEKQLLKSILKNTDEVFLKWALNAIMTWKNTSFPHHIVHIHANDDKILPKSSLKTCDFTLEKGGHLAIFTQAETISKMVIDD